MRRGTLLLILIVVAVLVLSGGAAVVVKSSGGTEAKRLAGLLPHVREKVAELRRRLAARGVQTFVGSTARTDAEQEAIRKRGNSATSNSWHELRRAIDLYPIGPDGKPDLAGRHVELFRTMHDEAKAIGFTGLAFNADGSKRYIKTNKGKVWDGGHLEWRDGLTWAAAAARGEAKIG